MLSLIFIAFPFKSLLISLLDFSNLESKIKSKSEIRRLIRGTAIKLNDQVITDEKFTIKKELFEEEYFKLSIGKKRHIKIKIN